MFSLKSSFFAQWWGYETHWLFVYIYYGPLKTDLSALGVFVKLWRSLKAPFSDKTSFFCINNWHFKYQQKVDQRSSIGTAFIQKHRVVGKWKSLSEIFRIFFIDPIPPGMALRNMFSLKLSFFAQWWGYETQWLFVYIYVHFKKDLSALGVFVKLWRSLKAPFSDKTSFFLHK